MSPTHPPRDLAALWLQALPVSVSTVVTVLLTEAFWQKGWEMSHLNPIVGLEGNLPGKFHTPTPYFEELG